MVAYGPTDGQTRFKRCLVSERPSELNTAIREQDKARGKWFEIEALEELTKGNFIIWKQGEFHSSSSLLSRLEWQ